MFLSVVVPLRPSKGGEMARNQLRIAAVLLLVVAVQRTIALNNGLSQKPPLGFNTWNYFGCDINESVIRTAADRLVALGLVEAGYNYLNIDDCWQSHERTANGQLQPDAAKFPSGMAALAAEVHSKGMKFGVYSDAGSLTCGGYPGSRHHELVDANTFADWGVDYLKLIAINQDDLGVAGDIIWKDGSAEIWAATLSNNQRAVVMFNRHRSWWPKTIRVTWAQLGYTHEYGTGPAFKAVVRDLYAERDLGVFENGFEARVSSHDVMAIRVTPVGQVPSGSGSAPGQVPESVWRPWSDASAAGLQAQMREASRKARKRADTIAKIVTFMFAHKYSIAFAVAVAVGAAITVLVTWWLRRSREMTRCEACPHSEMSFGKRFSIKSATPVKWEPLPSYEDDSSSGPAATIDAACTISDDAV